MVKIQHKDPKIPKHESRRRWDNEFSPKDTVRKGPMNPTHFIAGRAWDKATVEAIDRWRHIQPGQPTRVQAIHRLVEIGLASAPNQHPRTKARRDASDMAAKAIDEMRDVSASRDDQDKRKRRLLKGPSEFR